MPTESNAQDLISSPADGAAGNHDATSTAVYFDEDNTNESSVLDATTTSDDVTCSSSSLASSLSSAPAAIVVGTVYHTTPQMSPIPVEEGQDRRKNYHHQTTEGTGHSELLFENEAATATEHRERELLTFMVQRERSLQQLRQHAHHTRSKAEPTPRPLQEEPAGQPTTVERDSPTSRTDGTPVSAVDGEPLSHYSHPVVSYSGRMLLQFGVDVMPTTGTTAETDPVVLLSSAGGGSAAGGNSPGSGATVTKSPLVLELLRDPCINSSPPPTISPSPPRDEEYQQRRRESPPSHESSRHGNAGAGSRYTSSAPTMLISPWGTRPPPTRRL